MWACPIMVSFTSTSDRSRATNLIHDGRSWAHLAAMLATLAVCHRRRKMIRILEVAFHRNGCSGESFYAIRFLDQRRLLLGLVFEQPNRIVVIDPLHAAETVAAGVNSWRGDLYEETLRNVVDRFEGQRAIRSPRDRLRASLVLISSDAG